MKKLVAVVIACVFALALPCLAFAAPSGAVNGETTTSVGTDDLGNKAELQVTVEGADWVKVVPTSENAKNTAIPSNDKVVAQASYEVTSNKENVKVTLVYTTDTKFAGLTCYIFVEHEDGTVEKATKAVDSNGQVRYTMDKLSVVTFVVTNQKYNSGSSTAAAKDTGSTSPRTGVVA